MIHWISFDDLIGSIIVNKTIGRLGTSRPDSGHAESLVARESSLISFLSLQDLSGSSSS